MALILHANWNDGQLRLWAESYAAFAHALTPQTSKVPTEGGGSSSSTAAHPFAATAQQITEVLVTAGLLTSEGQFDAVSFPLHLPADRSGPLPSERLATLRSITTDAEPDALWLNRFTVTGVSVPNDAAIALLLRLEDLGPSETLQFGHSLRYWFAVGRFVLELLVDQRFIPTLYRTRNEQLRAAWQPWLHDEGIRSRVGALIAAMPPMCRAVAENGQLHPWTILNEALRALSDATVRRALISEGFADAIDELDPQRDSHVAWLSGLLGPTSEIHIKQPEQDLLRDASQWVSRLEEVGRGRPLQLCFKLNEPIESALLADNQPVPENLRWRLSLHLQSRENPERIIDAEQLWSQPTTGQDVGGERMDHPQELLLAELARAGNIYSRIEDALAEAAPTGIDLTTREAYEFLRQHMPILLEAGFAVIVPKWWEEPTSRLGARLQIEAPPLQEIAVTPDGDLPPTSTGQTGPSTLGLSALVQYRWQIAVGNQPLSMEEFQRLAAQSSPLVRVEGRWVEIRPDDMQAAISFLEDRSSGQMTLLEAVQAAYGPESDKAGLPVTGLDATGWVADLLEATSTPQGMPLLEQPKCFKGTLRPYQRIGLSWMSFLDRFGLGACLADDMGLGKTIQLIALLLHERQTAQSPENIGPTLLVVPTSVVSNWVRELERFSPTLRVHVQHGPDRPMNNAFSQVVANHDVIITTYALVSRDRETLTQVDWHRVVLDEAQYIKNPPTKQTAAIRALKAGRRLALTGTPVENRLTELWSIMEFCNPGYLGGPSEFRSRFAVPIERHRDHNRAEALRQLVRPFVLRRLKTDPKVISDLPPLVETKEYATLTPEQALEYERTVNEMLNVVDSTEGIQRRGLVLATLVKLKQICNFPQQLLRTNQSGPVNAETMLNDGVSMAGLSRRSGKTQRIIELLEEVLASDGKALIFTQFRQMGHLLNLMIRHELDCDTLFLHGGTPQGKRQQMIDRFQTPGDAPVFVLSLKAGGLGLNLTAANHVFHFDRWWNPAVENQATDRAFRIGQKRKVHVHKFVCVGTLEERIDQMIEQKTALAENIIGSGEQWITELSTSQLHELLTLKRSAAMEVEA